LYTRGFAWRVREANPMARRSELMAGRSDTDLVHRELYVEARTALPDSTLAIADRVARAAGMTLHLPFLDRTVVELACRVDSRAAQGHCRPDPLLALIARRVPFTLLPPAIDTRGQHGSTTASRYPWLPAALNTLVPSVLLGPRFDGRGIVSRPVVRRLWDEHTARRADHSHRLWSLLMLEFWFRHFIDGDAAADEPFEYAILRAA
jgi:asparagine synthase (glutamine-hydrolysing)